MQPIRQGDVLLIPSQQVEGQKLSHLILAKGESTGHSHCISKGKAELCEKDGVLYLQILSEMALLSHEEHQAIWIPQGIWMVKTQREYEPTGWKYVTD